MPIKIPSTLPATAILQSENVFVIDDERALHQDIRTLRVAILNLMPTKIATETQLLRLLGNTPLQVDVVLLHTASHEAKNTDAEHLLNHYLTFDEIREQRFDGLIITGAPVELMEFEEVDYWQELTRILDWADTNVQSTLHLCWGAQAGLYHRYGIPKYTLPRKMFGIFEHHALHSAHPLLRGFDETFFAPHSRHTEIRLEDLARSQRHPHPGPLRLRRHQHRRQQRQPPHLCHRPSRIRPADLVQRILARPGARTGDSFAGKLFRKQRPATAGKCTLAQPCQSAVRQLAELLRVSGDFVNQLIFDPVLSIEKGIRSHRQHVRIR